MMQLLQILFPLYNVNAKNKCLSNRVHFVGGLPSSYPHLTELHLTISRHKPHFLWNKSFPKSGTRGEKPFLFVPLSSHALHANKCLLSVPLLHVPLIIVLMDYRSSRRVSTILWLTARAPEQGCLGSNPGPAARWLFAHCLFTPQFLHLKNENFNNSSHRMLWR